MGCILTNLRHNHSESRHDRENLVRRVLTKLRRNHQEIQEDQESLLNQPHPKGILRQRRADHYMASSWDEIYRNLQAMDAHVGEATCIRRRRRGNSFLESFWFDLQRMQAEKRGQQRHVKWWDQ